MNNKGQSITEAMILISFLLVISISLVSLFNFGIGKNEILIESRNYFFSSSDVQNRTLKNIKIKKNYNKKTFKNLINNKKETIRNVYYGII